MGVSSRELLLWHECSRYFGEVRGGFLDHKSRRLHLPLIPVKAGTQTLSRQLGDVSGPRLSTG